MRIGFALVFFGVLACTASGPSTADKPPPVTPSQPEVEPDTKADDEELAPAISVQMTAATLADDCGGGPSTPPAAPGKTVLKRDEAAGKSKAKRRCEQSSMQLEIVAPAGAEPTELAVRSVELLLESGTSLGKLEARAPSVWSDADGYAPWDQHIEPGQDLSVSYALTQPDWSAVEDRWNQTYTVKAVLSIAGGDRTVEQRVEVDAPTSLPPNVKT